MKKVIIGLLVCFMSVNAYAKWTTIVSKDKMTGKVSAYAFSDSVGPDEKMDFPYQLVTGQVVVACDKNSEWAYFVFSGHPNLLDTKTEDGYSTLVTRVKVNEVKNVQLYQEFGSRFLHVNGYYKDYFYSDKEAFIKDLELGNNIMLELNWYGSGTTYFTFPLKGSTAAIKKIRRECNK